MSSPPSMNINCAEVVPKWAVKGKISGDFLHLPRGLVVHSPAQVSVTRWAAEIKLILPAKQTTKTLPNATIGVLCKAL